MRPILYVFSALVVMALAFWAYRENYATQKALRDLAALQDEISGLHEDIAMQKAEWAYLNRPTRLKELATVNFDRLQLLPLEPEQMGDGKAVAFPLPDAPVVVDTGNQAAAADGVNAPLKITGTADTSGDVAAAPDDKAFP